MRCVDPQHVHGQEFWVWRKSGSSTWSSSLTPLVATSSSCPCRCRTRKTSGHLGICEKRDFPMCFWPWKEYFAIFCQAIMSGSYAEYTRDTLCFLILDTHNCHTSATHLKKWVAYSWVKHFLFPPIPDLITLGFHVVLWWFNTAMEHDHIGKSSTSWRISHVFLHFQSHPMIHAITSGNIRYYSP